MPRPIEEPLPSRPAYFWWLLANLLALCFAVISWAVCLHVFGNPEIPRNYQILGKLGRLPEMKRYTILDVPAGSSLAPRELYRKYFGMDEETRERINGLLIRNYLTNFDRPLLLTYIEGDYQVQEVRELTDEDFITSGFAIRAQALVKPDDFTKAVPYPVLIEYVFPTADNSAAARFQIEDVLGVRKSPNCAVVLHVSKVEVADEQVLCLTVAPIAYGPYQVGGSDRPFHIEPPEKLNPAGGFPLFQSLEAKP